MRANALKHARSDATLDLPMNHAGQAKSDRHARSTKAFARSRTLLPGGVNSPVRAYKSVGRDPIFIASGSGAFVTDIDANRYVDYVMSYGPLILGHAEPTILKAITDAASRGTSFGMPTEAESELAQAVIDAVPSIEVVRFVNSGTEAAMSAVRLARAATGRSLVIKCTGCYHGHTDGLLVEAGSGAMTHGTPSSAGVTQAIAASTLLVPFNDAAAVKRVLEANRGLVAAMLVEPIAGNMGCVPPEAGYLQALRQLCDEHGTLLVFDEVMTGFRVALGGAQALYGVKPDITCLGKIIGGGLPCAAYGGSKALMKNVAPDGAMYQAGTLSGNPLAMAAGLAMIAALKKPGVYETLEASSARLVAGIEALARDAKVPVTCTRVGSMVTVFFTQQPGQTVENYERAKLCDTRAFTLFFNELLNRGVVLPPSQYETWFVSLAHDAAAIDQTLDAAKHALQAVAKLRA